MQRWIAVGMLVLMLIVGGGGFAYWNHKQNLPGPMWVPLPVPGNLSLAAQQEIIKELRGNFRDKELLAQVVKDLKLKEKWHTESERQAQEELSGRIFVRTGDMATPMGSMPAIHIGVTGKVRERALSGKIATRLMDGDDVWKILGIRPPPKR